VDERRLAQALEALLEEHRRRGSPAEEFMAHGATVIITRATRGRVAARLGWLNDWPGPTVCGGRMWLGYMALADISTDRGRRDPSRRPRFGASSRR
jgi:hypothetical protein